MTKEESFQWTRNNHTEIKRRVESRELNPHTIIAGKSLMCYAIDYVFLILSEEFISGELITKSMLYEELNKQVKFLLCDCTVSNYSKIAKVIRSATEAVEFLSDYVKRSTNNLAASFLCEHIEYLIKRITNYSEDIFDEIPFSHMKEKIFPIVTNILIKNFHAYSDKITISFFNLSINTPLDFRLRGTILLNYLYYENIIENNNTIGAFSKFVDLCNKSFHVEDYIQFIQLQYVMYRVSDYTLDTIQKYLGLKHLEYIESCFSDDLNSEQILFTEKHHFSLMKKIIEDVLDIIKADDRVLEGLLKEHLLAIIYSNAKLIRPVLQHDITHYVKRNLYRDIIPSKITQCLTIFFILDVRLLLNYLFCDNKVEKNSKIELVPRFANLWHETINKENYVRFFKLQYEHNQISSHNLVAIKEYLLLKYLAFIDSCFSNDVNSETIVPIKEHEFSLIKNSVKDILDISKADYPLLAVELKKQLLNISDRNTGLTLIPHVLESNIKKESVECNIKREIVERPYESMMIIADQIAPYLTVDDLLGLYKAISRGGVTSITDESANSANLEKVEEEQSEATVPVILNELSLELALCKGRRYHRS